MTVAACVPPGKHPVPRAHHLQMVHPLMVMFKPGTVLELDSQLTDTATISGDDTTGHTLAFEKYFKAGTFRGKIEIQVVKKTMAKPAGDGPTCVFAGEPCALWQRGGGGLWGPADTPVMGFNNDRAQMQHLCPSNHHT